MSLIFRNAVPDDLPVLLALYRHLNPDDPAPEAPEPVWRHMLGMKGMHVILGEEDGVAVSTCLLLIVPNLTRGGRAFGVIENVVTDAARQGRGIGTAMLRFALERAEAAGCYKVMLATGRNDEAVFRFYEKSGFTRGSKACFEIRLSS